MKIEITVSDNEFRTKIHLKEILEEIVDKIYHTEISRDPIFGTFHKAELPENFKKINGFEVGEKSKNGILHYNIRKTKSGTYKINTW